MHDRLWALMRRLSRRDVRERDGGLAGAAGEDATGGPTERGSIWDRSEEQYVRDGFKLYWETLEAVRVYQDELVSGSPDIDGLTHVTGVIRELVGSRGLTALSLGCQEGPAPEMALWASGMFSRILVVDLSRPLLDRQRSKAAAAGLTGVGYEVRDLNTAEIELGAWDVIFTVGTIHHLERLEHVFAQISRGLSSRGVFLMREYTGPNRLQFPDEHLAHVNQVLRLLPETLRRRHDGSLKELERPPVLADLIAVDPTEAVRSQEIIPVLGQALTVTRHVETGGTLLAPLLNEIASNFETTPEGRAVLPILIQLEKILISTGALPSYYCFSVARRRG